MKSVRFKQTHLECNLNFELSLERAEDPVSCWGDRRPTCRICSDEHDGWDCRPTVDLVLKDMCGGGKTTMVGVEMILDMLESLTSD